MGKWTKVLGAAFLGLALTVGVVGTALAEPVAPASQNAQRAGWGMGFGFQGIPDSVATLLGLDETQIMELRHEGKSLVEIAQTAPNPTDENALIAAIVAERQKAVDQRVADGKLTQDQATQMMERIKEQVKTMVEQTQTGPNRSEDGQDLGIGAGMGKRGGNSDTSGNVGRYGGSSANNGGYNGNCPYDN